MPDEDSYMLIKILERDVQALKREVESLREQGYSTQVALLQGRVTEIEKDLKALLDSQPTTYVPMVRYLPVEKVVFGLVGLILVAFVGAIIGLVIQV